MLVYNTHGNWATLRKIRRIEVEERGNAFPDLPYSPETPCIWICLKPESCLYYEPEMDLENLVAIEIEENDVLTAYDENDGFLLLRPLREMVE